MLLWSIEKISISLCYLFSQDLSLMGWLIRGGDRSEGNIFKKRKKQCTFGGLERFSLKLKEKKQENSQRIGEGA